MVNFSSFGPLTGGKNATFIASNNVSSNYKARKTFTGRFSDSRRHLRQILRIRSSALLHLELAFECAVQCFPLLNSSFTVYRGTESKSCLLDG